MNEFVIPELLMCIEAFSQEELTNIIDAGNQMASKIQTTLHMGGLKNLGFHLYWLREDLFLLQSVSDESGLDELRRCRIALYFITLQILIARTFTFW